MRHDLPAARATARANIALAKYWGKSDPVHNLPAVPSISLTLSELVTDRTPGVSQTLVSSPAAGVSVPS